MGDYFILSITKLGIIPLLTYLIEKLSVRLGVLNEARCLALVVERVECEPACVEESCARLARYSRLKDYLFIYFFHDNCTTTNRGVMKT